MDPGELPPVWSLPILIDYSTIALMLVELVTAIQDFF